MSSPPYPMLRHPKRTARDGAVDGSRVTDAASPAASAVSAAGTLHSNKMRRRRPPWWVVTPSSSSSHSFFSHSKLTSSTRNSLTEAALTSKPRGIVLLPALMIATTAALVSASNESASSSERETTTTTGEKALADSNDKSKAGMKGGNDDSFHSVNIQPIFEVTRRHTVPTLSASTSTSSFMSKLPTIQLDTIRYKKIFDECLNNEFYFAGASAGSRINICRCDDNHPIQTNNQEADDNDDKEKRNKRAKTLRRRMTVGSTRNELFESKYVWHKDKILGRGAYGNVYLATDKQTGQRVALKEISKEFTQSTSFQQEMNAMMYIRQQGGHPHICSYLEHFETPSSYLVILECVNGGELFDHLIQQGAYSEWDASRLIREVTSAIHFMHGIGMVHADIKPENILLSTTRRDDAVVKLADFGTAQIVKRVPDLLSQHRVRFNKHIKQLYPDDDDDDDDEYPPLYGAPTPAYCPPESIMRTHPIQASADMWGLGIILFIMLTGCHPFDLVGEASDDEIEARIVNPKKYYYDLEQTIMYDMPEITGHLSSSAKELILQLLHKDPKKRLTATGMLNHPWVLGDTADKTIIQGSDERLSQFKTIHTKLPAKFFETAVLTSDEAALYNTNNGTRPGTGPNTKANSQSSTSKGPSSNATQASSSFIETNSSTAPSSSSLHQSSQSTTGVNQSNNRRNGNGNSNEKSSSSNNVAESAFRKTSLIERSFKALDEKSRGFLTAKDILGGNDDNDNIAASSPPSSQNAVINMSDFSNLLSSHIQHEHYSAGDVIYRQGDIGNHMYFIDSGTVQVETKDGFEAIRSNGDFFGEGALFHPQKLRSLTVTCKTPVHVLVIPRAYFEKWTQINDDVDGNSANGRNNNDGKKSRVLLLALKEKNKIRQRNRAKAILRLQKNLKTIQRDVGESFFYDTTKIYDESDDDKKHTAEGEFNHQDLAGSQQQQNNDESSSSKNMKNKTTKTTDQEAANDDDSLFILEQGKVDILVNDNAVFSVFPGNVFGEHSVLTGRPRNCTAKCVASNSSSNNVCIAQQLMGRDVRRLFRQAAPELQASLRDLQLRREFKKAVVLRMKKEFPYSDPHEAFTAAAAAREMKHTGRADDAGNADDMDKVLLLDKTDIASLMRELNPNYSDDEIDEVLQTLNLTESGTGTVTYEEFQKVFIGDIRTSASM